MDLIGVASNLYYHIYEFCRRRDYTIHQAYVFYKCDSVTDVDLTDVWADEAKYWADGKGEYYLDITSNMRMSRGGEWLQRMIDTSPHNVTDMLYVINYTWGNNRYKFASRSDTVYWPPGSEFGKDVVEMKFRLPITEAWACTKDGRQTMNITKRFRKFAGPKGDFHNQDVTFSDIMKYDLPGVKVKTILGEQTFKG